MNNNNISNGFRFFVAIKCCTKTCYAIWPLSVYYCPLFRYFLLTLLKWHDRMVVKLNPPDNGMYFKPRFKNTHTRYSMDTTMSLVFAIWWIFMDLHQVTFKWQYLNISTFYSITHENNAHILCTITS